MKLSLQPVIAIILLVFASQTTMGHDLWLIPPAKLANQQNVIVRANVGMDFPKSEHAPDTSKFARRMVVKPDGTDGALSAGGIDDNSGLLEFSPGSNGIYIVAVQTEPRLITLEADDFNHYLISDGLPHIYNLRRKEGTLNTLGRERYSKSPKALVQVGNSNSGDPCRVLGLPLEIVPLRNPIALHRGDTLQVRVLFQNKPLSGANLGWDLPGDGEQPSGTVRTDDKGEAFVPISQIGLMTIRLTHMTRPKHADYEWESFWTTFTFRITGRQY